MGGVHATVRFLSVAGLVTYFVYPAAPPWWAAKYGLLEDVARISTRGWQAIGLHGAGNVLNAGQIAANPVAAMPSLHTAFALFVVVFFLARCAAGGGRCCCATRWR